MYRLKVGLMCMVMIMSSSQSVQANPAAAAGVAKFFGEYLLGKALDNVWDGATGKPNIDELQSRLSSYERSLARVDDDLSRKIRDLRKSVDSKTTPAEVRVIVRQTLKSLEDRIQKAEGRLDSVEARITEIEALFGFLPTITPAPLLRSSVATGRPEAHPRVKEWITLLCESETSRHQLIVLRRDYRENSSKVKNAKTSDSAIIKKTRDLHQATKADLAVRLQDREDLLQELKPSHPKVRQFDDQLASLLWLVGVTQPIKEGENKGRLPVPTDMLGAKASDILVAFELAGADVKVTASLYRQLFSNLFHKEKSVDIDPTIKDSLPDPVHPLLDRSMVLSESLITMQENIAKLALDLKKAKIDYSDLHPSVIALKKKRSDFIKELKNFHQKVDRLLTETISAYVTALRTERPTNKRMTTFRQSLLLPVQVMTRVTDCRDWENSVETADTWIRMVSWKGYYKKAMTNSIGMKLKLIPSGEFLMGSPDSEEHRSSDEGPQHKVKITKPFYMGVYEVTQKQWKSVMGTTPWKGKSYAKEGDDYAANYVNWEDAQEFIKKLNKKEGVTYRLPTEAEWEYACRAGSESSYCFGESTETLKEYAWFDDNADEVGEDYAHRVGLKKANSFGLHDMHGNVYEWCSDWYDSDYYETFAGKVTENPQGPSSGSSRVLRGGSWGSNVRDVRSSYRYWDSPDFRDYYMGFRVVIELE